MTLREHDSLPGTLGWRHGILLGMGFLDKLLIGGAAALVGAGLRSQWRDMQETQRRKSSPLHFDDGLTARGFAELAEEVARRTTRVVRADVKGMTVDLLVRSNSGLTTWEAQVDFNDYGRLTGRYWLKSGNDQSPIPKFYADRLREELARRISAR